MWEESPLGKQPELQEKYLPRRKWDKKKATENCQENIAFGAFSFGSFSIPNNSIK